MSYNVNLVPNIAPQGTVMQYTGATDPSGWVICDGQARSNTSGFYNKILTSQLVNVPNANTTLLTSPLSPTGSLLQTNSHNRVSLNGDGTILFTLKYAEYLYISYNSGNTWLRIINGGTSQIGFGIAISNNGNVLAYTEYISGKIYVSTNSGVSYKTGPTSTYANWGSCIVMSGDGSFMLTLTEGQGTYISINSGSTWSLIGTGTNLPASTIGRGLSISNGLSPNGYYVAIFGNATELYLSTNTGNWWSNVAPIAGKTWYTNAISGNGKYILAGSNEYLYLSSTTGSNWTPLNNAIYGSIPTATKIWTVSAMNFNGNYMIAGNTTDSSIYISSNYGNWWTTVQSPTTTFPANSIGGQLAMSPFGSNVFACNYSDYLYLSTNYGYSWNRLGYASATNPNYMPITSNWGNSGSTGSGNPVAISQNGNVMAAVSKSTGGVYVSTNSGNNWINYKTGSISASTAMYCIAMNIDGTTMVTTYNNYVHISTNTGAFWTQMTCPTNGYNSIGISGDATKIIVSSNGGPTNYFTTNSGSSWTLITNSLIGVASNYFNNTCAINQTGNVMVMCLQNAGAQAFSVSTDSGATWRLNGVQVGQIISVGISNSGSNIIYTNVYTSQTGTWLSTNYGVNFKSIFSTGNACSMSGDGTIMTVGFSGGNISLSTNSGNSWTTIATNLGNKNWDSVTLSNDGTKMISAVYGDTIYVSNQAFSSSTYYSTFTPMNIASTTTTDGTTLKYIMKY